MSNPNPEHAKIIEEYIKNAKANTIRHYLITVARDGEEIPSSLISFDTEKEALEGYEMYQDAGFAKHQTEVSLYEPSGKINTKILKRNHAGDPSFVRQNYIDTANALHKVKDKLSKNDYEDLCVEILTSFARDNWRFDVKRFLKQLEIEREI
jgi:hypothetical protein